MKFIMFIMFLIVYVTIGMLLEEVLNIKDPVVYAGIYFWIGVLYSECFSTK